MRSSRRDAPSGFFRGSEMARMMGMILLLGVLVMLMGQSADPRMWEWLTEKEAEKSDFGTAATARATRHITHQEPAAKSPEKEPAAKPEKEPEPKPEPRKEAAPAEGKPEVPAPAAEKASEPKPEAQPAEKSAPPAEAKPAEKPAEKGETKKAENPEALRKEGSATEEDEEQWEAFQEETQTITDKGLNIRREEMIPYWRLFLWADSQSFADMAKKSRGDVVLDDFISHPDEMRGKLVRLKLNVRRVLAYDAPDNPIDAKKIYEVWGFTDESSWLYAGVTAELPPDMPMGPKVNETAVFVGYFFKLQGYQAAGAGPKDRALSAPLLVGRLEWKKTPSQRGRDADSDGNWWIWGVVATIILLGGARVLMPTLFGSTAAAPVRPLDQDVKVGSRWDDEEEPKEWEVQSESWRGESNPDDWKRGKKSDDDEKED